MSKQDKRDLRALQAQQQERELRDQEKKRRRQEKLIAANQKKIQEQYPAESIDRTGAVDVACLIHSHGYSWNYVERLFNMVVRNLSRPVRFHVYTEHDRSVPPHMIKHNLEEWPNVFGPRKSWWYKIQLFNSELFQGQLLYFDLDTVIVGNLDWITNLHTKFMWAPKDFRSLWRPTHTGINSSIMWFDTRAFNYIYKDFSVRNLEHTMRSFHGDQDFISETVDSRLLRFFPPDAALSWRWQAKDGGINFKNRLYLAPDTGTRFTNATSILIFHGSPKPHEVTDPVITNFWQ